VSNSQKIQIAQELHDGIAQDLVALGYQLDLLLGNNQSSPSVRIGLRNLRFRVDELITKVRLEIFQLRSQNMNSLAERIEQSGLEICGEKFSAIDFQEVTGSLDQEEELYVIACELLRNSIQHSGASVIEVSLSQNQNLLYLEVKDNGDGGAIMSDSRFGLKGIKEKVASAKGLLRITSDENGTRVQVTL
jgi:signal transduction histidine kinase